MENMVSDGLNEVNNRSSKHSLEAAELGLRKSTVGKYEPIGANKILTAKLENTGPAKAYGNPGLRRLKTIVPEKILD